MRRSAGSTWLIDVLAQIVVTVVTTVVIFQLWDRPIRVPFTYTGDALTQASVVDGIITTGWWFTNPRLGAPERFEGYDFPLGGEMAHYFGLKVGSWFSDDPYLLTNAYFLAGFVLVAVSAFITLRLMAVGRLVAHLLALLYAFAPYHFLRGTEHLTLAAYWSVPLGCLLVWWVLAERGPFVRVDAHERPWRVHLSRDRRQSAGAAVAVVLVAFGGAYYAAFTALCLVVVGVVLALRHRTWRALAPAAVVVVALGSLIVASAVPSVLYWESNGRNPQAGQRPLADQDVAPLRPIQLLTPVPQHRVEPFDELGQSLLTAPDNSEPSQFLGVAGSLGLVLLLGSIVGAVAGRTRRWWSPEPEIALVVVALMLVGVSGGFGWLTATVGLNEIRAWGRVSIVIAFWSLLAVGRPLQHLLGRLDRRLASAVVAVIALLGLFDQVPTQVPDPRPNRGEFFADQRFYSAMEAELTTGAAVFQLPFASYPEASPVHVLPPSQLLRPLLATDDLRWSFGAMRGREADWMEPLSERPAAELADALAALGYSALTVDRAGYVDNAAELEAQLSQELGPPTVSETGRVSWFDLRPRRQRVEAALGTEGTQDLADSWRWYPTFWFSDGFLILEPDPERDQRWAYRSSRIEVWNRSPNERRGAVSLQVQTLSPREVTVQFTADGVTHDVVVAPGQWVDVDLDVLLQPGRSPIEIRAVGPDLPGGLHLIVRDPLAVVAGDLASAGSQGG